MATNRDQIQRYFDILIENYEIMRQALAGNRERGSAIYQELSTRLADGQRETLELAKQVSAQPGDVAANWSAILEAAVKAQERALSFASLAYEQTAGASSDTRGTLDRLVQNSRNAVQASIEMSSALWASNPMGAVWRRSMETFGATAGAAGEAARMTTAAAAEAAKVSSAAAAEAAKVSGAAAVEAAKVAASAATRPGRATTRAASRDAQRADTESAPPPTVPPEALQTEEAVGELSEAAYAANIVAPTPAATAAPTLASTDETPGRQARRTAEEAKTKASGRRRRTARRTGNPTTNRAAQGPTGGTGGTGGRSGSRTGRRSSGRTRRPGGES